MMRLRVIAALFAVSFVACASVGQRSRDYMFGVTGVVTGEDGMPLQGAEVTLKLDGAVYSGVANANGERRLTDSAGGFVFMYNAHERAVRYSLLVRKEGFEEQTVTGSAPPSTRHEIRLKKTSG